MNKRILSLLLSLALLCAMLPAVGVGATNEVSYAQQGIRFAAPAAPTGSAVPGDVDGSGEVDTIDSIRLAKFLVDLVELTDAQKAAADVNSDGDVTTTDAIRLAKYLVGLIDSLQPEPTDATEAPTEPTEAPTEPTEAPIEPLSITSQPQGASIVDGSKATLTVAVSGGVLPYSYQWYGDGIAINGATSPSYTTGEAGSYTCTITDGNGSSVTTKAAVVTVYGASDKPYKIEYKLVEYNVNKGDEYIGTQYIDNSGNPKFFGAADSFELMDVTCPGYEFLGWFTASGTRVTEVAVGTTNNLTLYARWSEIVYTITYNLYQTPVTSAPTAEQKCYTVNKGNYNLYNPVINNYIFLGWYDQNGVEYKAIPIGTTGNIVLNTYYTSLRNLAISKTDNNPIIVEDRNTNVVYFTYEIGEIRNIPLTPDKPYWEIQSVAGLTEQKSTEYTTTISESAADSVAKTISDMTVNSNTWTLSETWNNVTTVNDTWAESIGKTSEQCLTEAMTSSNTLSVSNQAGGSSYHKTEDGSTVYDYNSKTETKDSGHQFDANVSGTYTNKLSANIGASNEYGTQESYSASNAYTYQGQQDTSSWSLSGSGSGSSAASDKDIYSAGIGYENGFEVNAGLHYGYHNNTNTVTKTGSDTVTVNSEIDENTNSWNSAETFSTTNQHSVTQSVRNTLSDIVTTTKEYGKTYSNGGTDSSTQGFSSSSSNTSGTTSTVTYSKLESTKTTTTYSVDGKIEGKYRCILVGTAHVFGVAGYDYNTKSFFAYTFSVMDDKTEEFLDYTPKGGNYTDCENSCLPFEIPIDVYEYVADRTAKTTGVSYRTNTANGTATIVGYSGDSKDVVIPSYVSDGKQAYRVTSISSTAFAGKDVRVVVLGEFIKSIPAGAFKNCSNLEAVLGSFTEIGDEAFAGCTKLTSMNIPSNVVKIGEKAFEGVSSINVRAINSLSAYAEAVKVLPEGTDEEIGKKQREITQAFVDSVLCSGAQNITLDLSRIAAGTQLKLEVPAIASIEIYGGGKVYNNFVLKSGAGSTALTEMTIRNTNAVPLFVDSEKLSLHKVFVSANAIALILKKDGAELSLKQDSTLESTAKFTVIGKNPVIKAVVSSDGAVGLLNVTGDFGYVHSIQGEENIEFSKGTLKEITEEEFENYIKGTFTITFDGNGGTPALPSKTIYSGSPIGELPTATRDYYTFAGWYTESDQRVTAEDTFSADITLYAHWTLNPVSDWVLASSAPADAQIVERKWTYTLTSYTTSSSSALDGWTLYDSSYVWSDWGSWSAWQDSYVASDDFTKVETRTGYHYYYFVCSNCGAHMHGSGTCYTWAGGCGYNTVSSNSYHAVRCAVPYSSALDFHGTGVYYTDNTGEGRGFAYINSGSSYYVAPITQYRYCTRSQIWTYYYSKTEDLESYTYPSGENISNVEEWVKYRAK